MGSFLGQKLNKEISKALEKINPDQIKFFNLNKFVDYLIPTNTNTNIFNIPSTHMLFKQLERIISESNEPHFSRKYLIKKRFHSLEFGKIINNKVRELLENNESSMVENDSNVFHLIMYGYKTGIVTEQMFENSLNNLLINRDIRSKRYILTNLCWCLEQGNQLLTQEQTAKIKQYIINEIIQIPEQAVYWIWSIGQGCYSTASLEELFIKQFKNQIDLSTFKRNSLFQYVRICETSNNTDIINILKQAAIHPRVSQHRVLFATLEIMTGLKDQDIQTVRGIWEKISMSTMKHGILVNIGQNILSWMIKGKIPNQVWLDELLTGEYKQMFFNSRNINHLVAMNCDVTHKEEVYIYIYILGTKTY